MKPLKIPFMKASCFNLSTTKNFRVLSYTFTPTSVKILQMSPHSNERHKLIYTQMCAYITRHNLNFCFSELIDQSTSDDPFEGLKSHNRPTLKKQTCNFCFLAIDISSLQFLFAHKYNLGTYKCFLQKKCVYIQHPK